MLAWHFLKEDCKLQFEPHTEVIHGLELEAKLPLVMSNNGLHASKRIIDALDYAPGPVVCRVELSGEMLEDDDKICAQKRIVLWMYNASKVLHEFACVEAEQDLMREREAGREPDESSWQAIEVKRKWLRGEATDDELAATGAAARAAARAAAWAAWAAARAAARKEQIALLREMIGGGEIDG